MKRTLLTAACFLMLAKVVYSQTPGAIDIHSLRNSVLSQAAANLHSSAAALAQSAVLPAPPTAAQTWGVEVMVVPDLFARTLPDLASGPGLLITNVLKGSPADQLGLRKGMVLLDVNRRRLTKECELPQLDKPLAFVVLTNDGAKNVEIHPDPLWLEQLENPLVNQLGSRSARTVLPIQEIHSACSVSMAEANGRLSISAMVPTPAGEREVSLRGTRAEVESQLQTLPVDVQAKLRPQIGF